MTRKITFLGLGAMGSALAGAAIDAGLDVTVWNRTANRAACRAGRRLRDQRDLRHRQRRPGCHLSS